MIKFSQTKKKIAIFFLVVFYAHILCSQDINLIPKVVYVGDEAEIRFNFDWDGNLYSENAETFVSLVTESSLDETLENDYTIKSMQLFPSQEGFVLSVLFIPWKSGTLDMEAFDLATIFSLEVNTLLIDIPEVHIESILKPNDKGEINPPIGPVIIPGTTYVLIAILVVVLIVAVFTIIIFSRMKVIKAWIKSFFGKIWASNNFKKASRDLLILSKQSESLDSKIFAARLSVIIRTYLEGRFSHRFTAETTSSFFHIFDELFAGTVSSKASNFLQDLYEICVRCDFLHYAGVETEKAPLTTEEIGSLINRTQKALVFFEKDTDEESTEEGGNV